MKKIHVLGSLNMDLVVSSPYMPENGETITGSGFMTNPGGKGANQAAACGKLGGDIVMAGCVGTDGFGSEMLENLKKHNVDVSKIRRAEGSSGIAVIVVVDGDNRIILDCGANGKVTEADVDNLLAEAKEGDIFLTQLENPIDIVGYALKAARERGLYTILNPAPWNDGIIPYIKYADLFTPNETELALATGTKSVDEGAEKLFELGVKETVITLGGDGNLYCSKGEKKATPCAKVKVVDTTAAGDTFTGALAVKMSEGVSCKDAVVFAGAAASLAVTKRGAIMSIPKRSEVEEFLKNI